MSIDHINLRRLDLNLLLAFDALMRTQSVSTAADLLSLGQPAMSHSLRRLRDLFGDELLRREGGRLKPTDRGLALWAPVRDALEGLETGLDMAQNFDPATADRIFRLSLPDYLAKLILPRLLCFTTDAPGLRFRIESLDRELGQVALLEGRLDAFVGVMPPTEWIDETQIFEDDFVTLFDPSCWTAKPDNLDAYCAAPHLLTSQADSFSGWVDSELAALGRARRVIASVARFGDAIACVAGTDNLVTLPRHAAQAALGQSGLDWCAPPLGPRRFTINLYRRCRSVGAPASDWLSARLQDCLA